MRRIIALFLMLLFLSGAALAQSLGDVARQTRQKEKARGTAKKKVVTNEDIPERPELSPGEQETFGPMKPKATTPEASAEEWKSLILAQKNRIANLQTNIEKVSSSIRFVEANAYVNGAKYNQYQAKKQQQVENMKTQLAEQQRKLEEMQDAAKKTGMGSAVYDP